MSENQSKQPDIEPQQEVAAAAQPVDQPEVGSASLLAKPKPHSLWLHLMAIVSAFFVLSIILWLASTFLVSSGSMSQDFAIFTSYGITLSATICFAWWLMHHFEGKFSIGLAKVGFNPLLILYGVAMLILVGIVAEPLTNTIPSNMLDQLNAQIANGGNWIMLTTVVLAPILEELLFRGVLQSSLQRRLGPLRAIIISAAMFGIIHGIPQQVIYGFFAGLILGYIYYRTRSLWSVIGIHMLNNGITYLGIKVLDMKDVSLSDIITNNTLYWSVYAMCTALLIVSFWMLLQQISRSKDNNHA